MTRFWLGTHEPAWLERTEVPLFISRRRLERRRALPRARGPWALDSGGFTELSMHGGWMLSAKAYVALVRRYRDEIGQLAWAAPQDWMCEPDVRKVTGLTVQRHQELTTQNLLELRALAPDVNWVPVLQGWTRGEYEDHVLAYWRAGIDLRAEPLVGVGTVCRRQATLSALLIFNTIADLGIRTHGFGLKTQALRNELIRGLVSADSMAWSSAARNERRPQDMGCTHASCANCLDYALWWRERLPENWL